MTTESTQSASRRIAGMFDSIAPTYDLLNRLLSLGLDRRWRKEAVRVGRMAPGQRWLDVAAGSGDMAFTGMQHEPGSHWTAADPSMELLLRLVEKTPAGFAVPPVLARAERLPFPDGHFDGVTVAFGVRNFADTEGGLSELLRVLKPGGRLLIVEFHPVRRGRWGRNPLVSFYLEQIIPMVGAVVSGRYRAYRYLAETSRNFWTVQHMAATLRELGFTRVQWRPLFMQSVMLTRAVK